jgi:hypothetical protein
MRKWLGPETPELLGEAREDVWRTIEGRVAALPNLPIDYARSDSKADCRANSVWQTRLGLPTFCACRVLAENSYLRLTQATNSTFFGEKRIQMNRHKFKVGQTVMYLARERTSGTYKITQLMPSEGGDFQYRIRNTSEPHERVVKESDLDRAA